MSIMHYGWVEAQAFSSTSWFIVFDLAFARVNPALMGDLFGIGEGGHFTPAVSKRGKPHYAEKYKTTQKTRLAEEGIGHTWTTAKELAAIDWNEERTVPDGQIVRRDDVLDPYWRTVFKLIDDLSTLYKPENIRMVIWFRKGKKGA